jgi:lipopolysaccharide transport system ATP-binding protein
VLFVSHNMAAVQSLCTRAVMLKGGQVQTVGPVGEVVQSYLDAAVASNTVPVSDRTDRRGDGSVRLTSVRVEGLDDESGASPLAAIRSGSRLKLTIGYQSRATTRHLRFIASICDMNNVGIYMLDSDATGGLPEELPAEGSVTCITEPLHVTPGRCVVNLMLWKGAGLVDDVQNAVVFDVEADDVLGSGKLPPRDWALGILKHKWMS